jgi:Holliday junction resolvase RusA-like endonuclease
LCETFSFDCNIASIGRFPDGGLAEIFLGNAKAGSHSDATAKDSAVVASLALQHGVPLETLRKALMRDSDGRASSPLRGCARPPRCGRGHHMSGPITVVVSGEPVPKGRPRMTRKGFAYTPAATRKYEAHGRLAAQLAMDGQPPIPIPVRAEITVDLPMPVSWSGKRRDAALRGDIRPTSRPDTDNYITAALDAINANVVADDAQVVELCAIKQFGTVPKLVVKVFPINAASSNRKVR